MKFAGRARGRLDSIDWDNCAAMLARCPYSWAWAVLRTWCDGWMTSARIISPLGQRPCAFGCTQIIDSLRHYARCPPMHRALRRARARPFPLEWFSRWGLASPSFSSFSLLTAACNMYNEARAIREWPLSAQQIHACALAGVRAMRLAHPSRASEEERASLAPHWHPRGA
eukprot:752392-Pyramimonas_sp.AAC.1